MCCQQNANLAERMKQNEKINLSLGQYRFNTFFTHQSRELGIVRGTAMNSEQLLRIAKSFGIDIVNIISNYWQY